MARKSRKENPLAPMSVVTEPVKHYQTAAYIRLSVEDGGRAKSDTLENQKSLVVSYIEQQSDLELVSVHCDNGVSGTTFHRPSFDRLMEEVKAKKINCIVVKDLSRFGRNYIETGNYLEKVFPFLGVRFVAINDSFDTANAQRSTDGYVVPLKNLINHLYAKDLSKKLGGLFQQKQRNGEFLGGWAPYGYQKDPMHKTKLIIDEDTAPTLKKIFHMSAEGHNYRQIIRFLNDSNILSPSMYRYKKGIVKHEKFQNSPWSGACIKELLTNQAYLGHMQCGQNYSSLFEGKPRTMIPREQWLIVENTHEALIDEATFRKVQETVALNAKTYKDNKWESGDTPNTENILQGLMFCKHCHKPLFRKRYFESSKKKNNALYYVFHCRQRLSDLRYCDFKGIREKQVLEAVSFCIKNHLLCLLEMEQTIRKMQEQTEFKQHKTAKQTETAKLQKKLDENKKYRKGLFQSYASKLIEEKEYLFLSKTYEDEQIELQSKLDECLNERSLEQINPHSEWIKAFKGFDENRELSREIVSSLVEKIELDSDKSISITLKYQSEYLKTAKIIKRWAANAHE